MSQATLFAGPVLTAKCSDWTVYAGVAAAAGCVSMAAASPRTMRARRERTRMVLLVTGNWDICPTWQ